MTSILFVLSNLTFPPKEGMHEQVVSVIKAMRSQGYEVSVLALIRDQSIFDAEGFADWVGGLKVLKIIPNRLNYLFLTLRLLLPKGSSSIYSAFKQMQRSLPEAVIHLEGIGLAPLLADTTGRTTIMSALDAWSMRQTRLAKDARGMKYLVLRFYAALSAYVERRFFTRASFVQVVSEVDAQWLRASSPLMPIKVIPVALLKVPTARAAYIHSLNPPVLVFWGDIGVPFLRQGLEWLFDHVRPRLESAGIFAEWVIVGRREPDENLRSKAGDAKFLGWIDDVDQVLRRADAVVLPDQNGTGLKNRALRAMACGVPVIGTPEAFEGFPVSDRIQALIRRTPEQFTEALLEVLTSPERANEVALAGRAFAINNYGLDTVSSQWDLLYQEAIAKTSTPIKD